MYYVTEINTEVSMLTSKPSPTIVSRQHCLRALIASFISLNRSSYLLKVFFYKTKMSLNALFTHHKIHFLTNSCIIYLFVWP